MNAISERKTTTLGYRIILVAIIAFIGIFVFSGIVAQLLQANPTGFNIHSVELKQEEDDIYAIITTSTAPCTEESIAFNVQQLGYNIDVHANRTYPYQSYSSNPLYRDVMCGLNFIIRPTLRHTYDITIAESAVDGNYTVRINGVAYQYQKLSAP